MPGSRRWSGDRLFGPRDRQAQLAAVQSLCARLAVLLTGRGEDRTVEGLRAVAREAGRLRTAGWRPGELGELARAMPLDE